MHNSILEMLKSLVDAIEAGEVAVDEVKDLSLDQLMEKSSDGWDSLKNLIEEGKKLGHEE